MKHALACPKCRYPFGSGGNLVTTAPPVLLRCSASCSRVLATRSTEPSLMGTEVWTLVFSAGELKWE